jgi:NitT/TauT family transport system permease protein
VPLTGLSSFVLPRPSQILARMMSEYRLLSLHAAVTAAEVVAGAAGLGDDPDAV